MNGSREGPNQTVRGILLMLLSLVLFACSEAAAKLMTASLPAVEVAWLRYLVFVILILGANLASAGRISLRSQHPLLQILRGLAGIGAGILFIGGLSFLPMAQVTAISFVSPLFVTILCIPLLGEQVGPRRWMAIAAGLAGALIIIRPGTGSFQMASILPLLAAFSWALSLVVTRKIGNQDTPLVSLTYASLVGLVATSFLLPFVWVTPDTRAILLGIVTGIFGTFAQWLVVLAFQHERASVLAPFSYTGLIWSTALGYLIFGNISDSWTFIGAAFIVLSGLYTWHRERASAR